MDYIITISRFLGAFVLFALFPITVQLIFYTIDKLIFKKHTDRRYTISA